MGCQRLAGEARVLALGRLKVGERGYDRFDLIFSSNLAGVAGKVITPIELEIMS